MKKIYIAIFLALSIESSASTDNKISHYKAYFFSDTTVLPVILTLPLSSYIGQPVDSLFSVLPGSYTSRRFIPTGIGYSKGISQSYYTSEFNTCYIEIFIDTFQHMTFPNRTKTTTWNMNLAKQETISFIKVWKNNQCVYGCNNPNYY